MTKDQLIEYAKRRLSAGEADPRIWPENELTVRLFTLARFFVLEIAHVSAFFLALYPGGVLLQFAISLLLACSDTRPTCSGLPLASPDRVFWCVLVAVDTVRLSRFFSSSPIYARHVDLFSHKFEMGWIAAFAVLA